jgi:hypothetical protein
LLGISKAACIPKTNSIIELVLTTSQSYKPEEEVIKPPVGDAILIHLATIKNTLKYCKEKKPRIHKVPKEPWEFHMIL